MRRLGHGLAALALVLGVALAGLWLLGPYEPVEVAVRFDPARLSEGVQSYIARSEGVFDDIRPGDSKQVVWAGAPGVRTPLALVYLHGFSASAAEVRPLPDLLAADLGANLFLTRFAGHGRTSEAMAGPLVEDWAYDTAEAMEIARALGDEVVILSTSTGGTLAALAALDPAMRERLRGIVFLSPNFGIRNPMARLLTWPAARYWLPAIAGRERQFTPRSPAQAAHWTVRYPSVATLPLAALVQHVWRQDYSAVRIPALFYFSDSDVVVDPERTREMAARWGGPTRLVTIAPGPGLDANDHVLAGDALSPAGTEPARQAILDWVMDLPPSPAQ